MLLEATDIRKIYRTSAKTELEVLKGVSVAVEEGEMVALVGPSGAGKSTLLHILGGLDHPTDGKVYWGKEDVYQLRDNARSRLINRRIGFVFQFYHLLPELSALENVILPLMIRYASAKNSRLEFKGMQMLEQLGLTNRADHKPGELSGGEQQRVAIGRALISEPKILLCDEPTGNLDTRTGEQIVALLKELNRKHKQTIVVVTHSERIAAVAGRVMFMEDGQLKT